MSSTPALWALFLSPYVITLFKCNLSHYIITNHPLSESLFSSKWENSIAIFTRFASDIKYMFFSADTYLFLETISSILTLSTGLIGQTHRIGPILTPNQKTSSGVVLAEYK